MTGSGTTGSEPPSEYLEAEIARVRRAIDRANERESQLRGIIDAAEAELRQVRGDREEWQGELRAMTVPPVRFVPTLEVPQPTVVAVAPSPWPSPSPSPEPE